MQAAGLGSKYFIAYDSGVNRLSVWDGTEVRLVGFAKATTPSVAEMGGTGITALRYFRQRFVQRSGTTIVRRSEASAAVGLSLANRAGWQITSGAVIGEGETHWEVEAADAEDGPWYRIATVAIATTLYEDTAATIDDTDLSDVAGDHVPPPSVKYILADTNRLLMAGAWEATGSADQTAPKQNRVWYTLRIGATDEGDDERIPNTVDQQNWVDVGNEGPITGLAGPLYGDLYVFKADSVFKLTPTGDLTTPYRVIQVMPGIGAVDQRVICVGEIASGAPAIFFASATSIYAITSGGLVELSNDVSRDLRMTNFTAKQSWLAFNPMDKILMAQTNTGRSTIAGKYHQFAYDIRERQWSGVSFGGATTGWILGRGRLGVDTILGGGGTSLRNAVVATNDQGATRLLLVGQNADAAAQVLSVGDVCGLDGAEPFTAQFRVRAFPTPGHTFSVGAPTIIYRNPVGDSGVAGQITITLIDQAGLATASTRTLLPTDQDDPLQQQVLTCDGLQHDDLTVLDLRVAMTHEDGFSSALPPSIDAFVLPVTERETLAQ
jgi:hypothetical protein